MEKLMQSFPFDAVAIDLDDTLLHDDLTISDRTLGTVRSLSAAGVHILPAVRHGIDNERFDQRKQFRCPSGEVRDLCRTVTNAQAQPQNHRAVGTHQDGHQKCPVSTFLFSIHWHSDSYPSSSNTVTITAGTVTVSYSLGENNSVTVPSRAPAPADSTAGDTAVF
jgi:hypothetical protein